MPSHKLPARKRWLVAAVTTVSLLAMGGQTVQASRETDLMEEQQNLEQQRQETESELQQVYDEAQEAQQQLEELDQQLAEASEELDSINAEIAATEAELAELEAELEEAQQKHDERLKVLGKRLRAISEGGELNYLELLLGSTSLQDFLFRVDALKAFIKQDAELLDEIKEEKLELAQKEDEVEARRTQLAALQERAQEEYNTVAAQRAEREVVSRTLDERKRDLEAQLDALDQEMQELQNRIWLLQQQSGRTDDSGFSPIYPVSGYVITDTFGPRLHPILGVWRTHYGTDFAVPEGTPVHAIEDGVVIVAEWSDSYGNLVVIDHGNGISSWYGHNSAFRVSVGDVVQQGDVIALAGSTGWATGPHVHLEIHVNGVAQDPMSFLP